MSNYFDNQTKGWAWDVSSEGVYVTTDHGNHTHTLDVTNVTVGDMSEKTGEVMGKAHRQSSHDYKDTKQQETTDKKSKDSQMISKNNKFVESLKVDKETLAKLDAVSHSHVNDNKTTNAKNKDEGGRERGDEGPGKNGRESGLKAGSKVLAMRADMKINTHNNSGQNQQPQVVKTSQMSNKNGLSTSYFSDSGISGRVNNGTTGHGTLGGHGESSGGHGTSSGSGSSATGHGGTSGHGGSASGHGGSGGNAGSSAGNGGLGGHGSSVGGHGSFGGHSGH